MQAILSARENRYLARQLCWVLTIQALETYILMARDSANLDLLVEAVRPTPRPTDLDGIIRAFDIRVWLPANFGGSAAARGA
jgi:PatG Domain